MVRQWLVTAAAGLSLLAVVGCAGQGNFERDRVQATEHFKVGNYTIAERMFTQNVYRG